MKRTLILAAISIIVAVFLCCIQFIVFAFPAKPVTTVSASKTFTAAFSFIRGHKQGKNTTVTWGMVNNAGINHFIVECTYEDPTDPYSVWRTVGIVPCTPLSPIFKLTDSPVLPGTLNYRVIAVSNDNSTTTSEIYTTYIQ
jgi:hypothetical protein